MVKIGFKFDAVHKREVELPLFFAKHRFRLRSVKVAELLPDFAVPHLVIMYLRQTFKRLINT